MRTQLPSALITTALAYTYFAAPAQAQSPRTFVSAAGNDSNTCTFAAPCRHFQAAVNATSAGGEVDALDPAGYSPIVISHPITIEGQGWSYIAPPASGNAITINAVSGNVTIRGVSLNGAGVTGGTNGIVFNSGDSLTVTNCVAQNFANSSGIVTGDGILMQPASGAITFAITNTIVSNNGLTGIAYLPPSGSTATANGVIDHVVANANQYGILIYLSFVQLGTTVATVSNSVVNGNSPYGMRVSNTGSSTTVKVSIDNVSVSGSEFGVSAAGTPSVLLGRSVITGNSGWGIDNTTSPNTLYSYGDNRINLNATDINNPLNTTFKTQ